MRSLIVVLIFITANLMTASYFGHYGLDIKIASIKRYYFLGCTLSKAHSAQFLRPLNYNEIKFCTEAAERLGSGLDPN